MIKNSKEKEAFYNLCRECFFPPLDLTKYDIPKEVLNIIPETTARAYKIIPIAKIGWVLTVAMADPYNIFVLDNLKVITNYEISPVITPLSQIMEAIERFYGLLQSVKEKDKEEAVREIVSFREEKFDLEEIAKLSKEAKIVNIVNDILSEAVKSRCSDIHIECFEKEMRIRYRVDGVLHEKRKIEKSYQEAIIARIKLMSKLDITQRKIPQDGRFGFHAQGRDIDVRVSVLPVDFGEKIVLRLLDKSSIRLDLESLGFSPYALEAFKKAIAKPFGMILLTGPTGSGKTTTLYSILNRLNTIERNIITIEDPVEYNLLGITQVPVRHEIGLDFAAILKATLRQSPDVIMVGEIRDFETADIAMKAALTGHIVLSTLHTNDAPSAITRLLNMEIEPFLIASSLNMIAAQRLVRKICSSCKISYEEDLSSLEDIPERFRKSLTLYKGKGCKDCNNIGYKGRLAVVEALLFDDKIRDMVLERTSLEEIRAYARDYCGMKTLREDGVEKCLRGETTIEEVIRVTVEF